MSVIRPDIPVLERQAFDKEIANFAVTPAVPGPNLPVQGVQVAVLALEDILSGGGLANAHPVAWAFLQGVPHGPATAAQVTPSGPGGSPALTSFSTDPQIAQIITAIHDVETMDQVQSSDYELWILRIPAILVESFWLKSRSGSPDLIVPFHTKSRMLQQLHPYTWEEFIGIVQPLAATFQGFDNP